jgi:hypothetical protein
MRGKSARAPVSLGVGPKSIRSQKMESKKFIYYKDGDMWIGWLEEYPDYRTQGETLEELEDNLRDIYADLSSDAVPYVHRVGELRVA